MAFDVTSAAEDDIYEIAQYLITHGSGRTADRFLSGLTACSAASRCCRKADTGAKTIPCATSAL